MSEDNAHEKSCQEMLETLSLYVDKEASTLLCEEIERHLATCTDCKVVLDTLEKTILLYQNLSYPDMPEGMRERLYHTLDLDEFLSSH